MWLIRQSEIDRVSAQYSPNWCEIDTIEALASDLKQRVFTADQMTTLRGLAIEPKHAWGRLSNSP